MIKLNKTTQKARGWMEQYKKSTRYSVEDFYGRCSYTKIAIEREILAKMDSMNNNENKNVYGYKILSGNCFHFVCAYRDEKYLYIETKINTFCIEL